MCYGWPPFIVIVSMKPPHPEYKVIHTKYNKHLINTIKPGPGSARTLSCLYQMPFWKWWINLLQISWLLQLISLLSTSKVSFYFHFFSAKKWMSKIFSPPYRTIFYGNGPKYFFYQKDGHFLFQFYNQYDLRIF